MVKYLLLGITLIISDVSFSQVHHRRHFRVAGFSLKTDILSLFEGVLEKNSKSTNLSGEMYFNEEFSIQTDLAIESTNSPGFRQTLKKIGGQFRWYFNQDDCNCSSFFTGLFLTLTHDYQANDSLLSHSNDGNHNFSILEGGLTGGFQALVNRHFIVDPALQIGMNFPVNDYTTEGTAFPKAEDHALKVRIMLGVGYRF